MGKKKNFCYLSFNKEKEKKKCHKKEESYLKKKNHASYPMCEVRIPFKFKKSSLFHLGYAWGLY